MELLKFDVIIGPTYKPDMNLSYLDYFNRALVFAQTNYHDTLNKITKSNFSKISPTFFFEEYVWNVLNIGITVSQASKLFIEISNYLPIFYDNFRETSSFPTEDSINNSMLPVLQDDVKLHAIYNCAQIINRGIKLFDWDLYKKEYLNTVEKLNILPLIGMYEANLLARSIGVSFNVIERPPLHSLATNWKFDSVTELCMAIQKNVPLQLKVIEVVLWYSAITFNTNPHQT